MPAPREPHFYSPHCHLCLGGAQYNISNGTGPGYSFVVSCSEKDMSQEEGDVIKMFHNINDINFTLTQTIHFISRDLDARIIPTISQS